MLSLILFKILNGHWLLLMGFDSCWGSEPTGSSPVKALNKSIKDISHGLQVPWKKLRNLNLPSKVQIFLQKLLIGRLPVPERINRFQNQVPPTCVMCNRDKELVEHLFACCPITVSIWNLLPRSIPQPSNHRTLMYLFRYAASTHNRRVGDLISWHMWKMINAYVF